MTYRDTPEAENERLKNEIKILRANLENLEGQIAKLKETTVDEQTSTKTDEELWMHYYSAAVSSQYWSNENRSNVADDMLKKHRIRFPKP